MKTLSTISILPSNKAEIDKYCQNAKQEILAGYNNPLEVLRNLKAFETIIKILLSDAEIKETILDEAEKHGKSFDEFGCKFSIRETGVKYDYTKCNDSVLDEINLKILELQEKKKKRENFLKSINDNDVFCDVKTGEILRNPTKKSTTSVVVTLK